MKSVGIKQLKARLSEFVRLAKSGETILITDRKQVVAELGPRRRQAMPVDELSAALEELAARGDLTLPAVPKNRWTWKVRGLGLAPGAAAALLDQVRGDR